MKNESLQGFYTRIKEILAKTTAESIKAKTNYIELASLEDTSLLKELIGDEEYPANPLGEVFALTLEAAANCHIDKVKLAINELLKHYLCVINSDNQEEITGHYIYRLKLIFKRCLQGDFPYQDDIWNYIGESLKTVGLFLLENNYQESLSQVLEALAAMGKSAARKGLPTAGTQASLRIIENRAREKSSELADAAKNFRFNLEIY